MSVTKEILEKIENKIFSGFNEKKFEDFIKNYIQEFDVDQSIELLDLLLLGKKWPSLIKMLMFLEYSNVDALPKDYHATDITRNVIIYYHTPYAEMVCAKMLHENVNPFALYEFPVLNKYKDPKKLVTLEEEFKLMVV